MRLSLLAVLLHLFLSVGAAVDTVVVVGGDELHGKIEKLEAGKLYLKTSYAGAVRIDWDQVVEIDSEAGFLIETDNGRRLRGLVRRSGDAVAIQSDDIELEFSDARVVEMTRLTEDETAGFWDTLKGSVGVGYSLTGGNSEQSQASLAAEGSYRRDRYAVKSDLSSIFSRLEDAESASRHALNNRYDRFLSPRSFAFGVAAFERNDRQLLNLRSRFGGGFGWKAVDDRKTALDLLGGLTFTNERFRQPEEGEMLPAESTGEGLLGFEWQSTRLWGVRLTTRMTGHPSLRKTGRYRIEYDSSARIPLVAGFTWKLSLFDRFDSDPPREEVERNDYGLISTLGFAF